MTTTTQLTFRQIFKIVSCATKKQQQQHKTSNQINHLKIEKQKFFGQFKKKKENGGKCSFSEHITKV